MAAVDILYIDITRRWNSMALDQRDTGTRWLPCLTGTGRASVRLLSFYVMEARRGVRNGVGFKP